MDQKYYVGIRDGRGGLGMLVIAAASAQAAVDLAAVEAREMGRYPFTVAEGNGPSIRVGADGKVL